MVPYGNPREPEQAIKWLWKFIDAAGTPGELYGRALVVLAAEQYALRLVLPTSQRTPATRWGSHKDLAAKALKKLAGPHVPASLTKLEQAVKRAHNAHAKAEQAHHEAQHAARRRAEQPAGDTPDETATEQPVEEELDELDAEAV